MLFLALLLSTHFLCCQNFIPAPKQLKQSVTVNFDTYTVKTQILAEKRTITAQNDKNYLWYRPYKIMETQGGYDGKLIHGKYAAFYLNDQLKESGEIKYGLREGEWKYWYADGSIREIIEWRKGLKNGTYILFNDFGNVMARGKFKNNKLHGNFITYDHLGKKLEKKRYKSGVEEIQKKRKHKKKPSRLDTKHEDLNTQNSRTDKKRIPGKKKTRQASEKMNVKQKFIKFFKKQETKKVNTQKGKSKEVETGTEI